MNFERISDDRLRQIAKDKRILGGWPTKVGEGRGVVGSEIVEADVLIILGSERGLWDEIGYSTEPTEREFDEEFSRLCILTAFELWYRDKEGGYPLLVKLVLLLKHGVRRVNDESLICIFQLLSECWSSEKIRDPIIDCRMATLRQAVACVLRDRGYKVQ